MSLSALSTLEHLTHMLEERASAPYSGNPIATVVLLSDGAWIPGVRIESASFPLSMPALLNGITTAVALGRTDIVAVAQNVPFSPQDHTYLLQLPFTSFVQKSERVQASCRFDELPAVGEALSPFLKHTPDVGIDLVRRVAARAYVPESQFPVGCILVRTDGSCIPGVNVEHPDWGSILCAERNALGTAVSYGLSGFSELYLTCLKDAAGSPCGACRQLLAEFSPELKIFMDRQTGAPEVTTPGALLPGFFTGTAITHAIG